MFIVELLVAILSLLLQASSASSFPDGVLTATEKLKIEKESKVESRVKVYQAASSRIHRTIQSAISNSEFSTLPSNLELWTALLEGSLQDIEANLTSKKKPRPLINYEIHLRKAIAATRKSRIVIPIDQLDILDSYLARAATVHKKIVDMLFRR